MQTLNDFFMRLSRILKNDRSFKDEAYYFVMASLGRLMEKLDKPRHVTGQELLRTIREEAETQFGPMAVTVFSHWGIQNSLDFGRIVFNMAQEGILTKQETDRIEDFKDEVFFQNLFDVRSGYRLPEEESVLKKETECL